MVKDPAEALHEHFGFREFLDGQEPVISSLLSGRDTLAIMPTGGGKSLCYQLPAMVMDGVTLVVSPLIALMKDQVDALIKKGIPAAMINSTMSLSEQQACQDRLRSGELKLVYIAPERFRSGSFRSALGKVDIALFAVDEAHCLSQWGHDFRPDYLRLEQTLNELGHPQVAAFTATATPQVREDILKTLQLRDPYISVTGFERPNLSLRVLQVESNREKYAKLKAVVKQWKTGVVYCATRKRVEEVWERLSEMGLSVVSYHGGMDDADRSKAQNAFLDGTADVVVATNAFGMGIDRPDVRFVVHFELPGSIEAYYQEAGRAGRDREPAVCELLFNYADTATQEFFIDGSNPSPELIRRVYAALHSHADEMNEVRASMKELTDWVGEKNGMATGAALSALGRANYIQRFDIPGARVRGTRLAKPEVTADDLDLDEHGMHAKEQSDRAKLQAMVRYGYADQCRQEWILEYFGEDEPSTCGSCDICQSGAQSERREPEGEEEEIIVKKALSGVARMSQKTRSGWQGRFGRGKIVNMLVGSKAADILDKKLDQLSTYGLLKEEGSAYVYALFKELEKEGLVITEGKEYPLFTLTERGSQVMLGKAGYKLSWPDRAKLASSKSKKGGAKSADIAQISELGFDKDLFAKLKAKRAELAEAEGNKPAFTIFADQTLEFFTRLKPTTVEAGLRIRGVGPVKAEKYLEAFLEVIREHKG